MRSTPVLLACNKAPYHLEILLQRRFGLRREAWGGGWRPCISNQLQDVELLVHGPRLELPGSRVLTVPAKYSTRDPKNRRNQPRCF